MITLALHEFHQARNACFGEVNGAEVVQHYGHTLEEYRALRETAGVLDLSFRSRLRLTGADRQRFLHGQVTNNILDLDAGEGCYAALVTARGRMQSDLNVYCLTEEILLDFEPGFRDPVMERLGKYIIADDVQVETMETQFGLASVQGPQAGAVVQQCLPRLPLPVQSMVITRIQDPSLRAVVCMNNPRGVAVGFDLWVPLTALPALLEHLLAVAGARGGRACGWDALEMVRIEAGIPRFGLDMDETNLPPETGIEQRAISYTKGCYIGQEVIARIRTYGQVARSLRGLRLADRLPILPRKGDKLFHAGKEVGTLTSALASAHLHANIALGYVRREHNQFGTELTVVTAAGESPAHVVPLPFAGN